MRPTPAVSSPRRVLLERVEEAAIVQLYCDGFAALSLREKRLAWHLYLAALAGRDIYFDQRYAHGLEMRAMLEPLVTQAARFEPGVGAAIRTYAKRFWMHSGPFNSLTARRFVLGLTLDQWNRAVSLAAAAGAFPGQPLEEVQTRAARLAPLFLDPAIHPVVTDKTPSGGADMLQSSANNLYDGVSMADLEPFEERYGLNARLVKRDGRLVEEVCRIGGRYDREIRQVVRHLRDAMPFASGPQARALTALVRYYETGEAGDREVYDIAWLEDRAPSVDTINGFVEVYLDPRGVKGAWEGIVYCANHGKTRQIETIAAHAQWFEDRMPWDPAFRKPHVTGVTAMAVDVVVETGDAGPMTAIGINLPNDQAIRERYGSRSVSLVNVSEAYEQSVPDAMRTEFAWSPDEAARARRWGAAAQSLATDLHEVIGHGSGRMAPDAPAPPHVLLKEHYSAIEEARADLVALYWIADPVLVSLGLVEAADHEAIVRAEYEGYARGALLQLRRARGVSHLEEDHMRNRQLVVEWLRRHTTAIALRRRDGRTFYVMTDVAAFRAGVARLLADVQRIKSCGDYEGAKTLVEGFGVHFDPVVRDEILARVDALDLPSYTAFVMPRLQPVYREGAITDIEMSYPCDFEAQMLEYSAFSRHAGRLDP